MKSTVFTAMTAAAMYAQTRVIGQLNNGLIAEDAIVVAASGSLPSDLERLWRVTQPDTYHLEYGFSCMGYEVSGALGAKLAAPDREVYCLVGDGGYLMLHSEIVTAIQEGIKINIILFNNHGFDCIDNLQISQGIPHFGCQFRYRTKQIRSTRRRCVAHRLCNERPKLWLSILVSIQRRRV